MTTANTVTVDTATDALVGDFIHFLETGEVRDGLFSDGVFCDFTLPLWRLQAVGRDEVVAMRLHGHPMRGKARQRRLDRTPTGFLLEVEETWEHDGTSWYCRELMRADVAAGSICDLSVYCTGDWDAARVAEHAAAVTLIRP